MVSGTLAPMELETAPARLRALPTWLLAQAALQGQRIGAETPAAAGAHRSHYAVLAALDEFGPASQAALGRRCGIDPSDMVALMAQMTGDGLVERGPDPADRRRNIVSLTAAGRRRLDGLAETVGAAQDALLAPLSAAERDHLTRLLTRIVESAPPADR
jgi:MarR family transcriptional regulator, lower aerobic nicotinate degradation pathway regulator